MVFHVNAEGEVGKCGAQIRCPFGDFETQHYITEGEARAAYEAAMRGETFERSFVGGLKENKRMAKFLQKKRDKMKKFVQPIPEPEQGYLVPTEPLMKLRYGDEYGEGKVVEVDRINSTRRVTVETRGQQHTYAVPLDDNGQPLEPNIFASGVSPEDAAVREMKVSEQNLAVGVRTVLTDCKRKMFEDEPPVRPLYGFYYTNEKNEKARLSWNPRGMFMAEARKFKVMVEQAEKSGIANPHNFALARFKATMPQGEYQWHKDFQEFEDNGRGRCVRLVEALATLNDGYKPDHLDKLILNEAFEEGERPFLDYDFNKAGLKTF